MSDKWYGQELTVKEGCQEAAIAALAGWHGAEDILGVGRWMRIDGQRAACSACEWVGDCVVARALGAMASDCQPVPVDNGGVPVACFYDA